MCCHQLLLVIFAPCHAILSYYKDLSLSAAWFSLGGLSVILVLIVLFIPRLALSHRAKVALATSLRNFVLLSCVLSFLLYVAGVFLHTTGHNGLAFSIAPPLLALCLKAPPWAVCLVVTLSLSTVILVLVWLCPHYASHHQRLPSFAWEGIDLWTELACWLHIFVLVLALVVSKGLELENKSHAMAKESSQETLWDECQNGVDTAGIPHVVDQHDRGASSCPNFSVISVTPQVASQVIPWCPFIENTREAGSVESTWVDSKPGSSFCPSGVQSRTSDTLGPMDSMSEAGTLAAFDESAPSIWTERDKGYSLSAPSMQRLLDKLSRVEPAEIVLKACQGARGSREEVAGGGGEGPCTTHPYTRHPISTKG